MMNNKPSEIELDLDALRERLRGAEGPQLFRSLEELSDTPQFTEFVQREFPDDAAQWTDPVTRRRFLTLMGASFGLAGLSGCLRAPAEKIVPYVKQPAEFGGVLGKPHFYATAVTLGGYAQGLLVESHEGRPTKIEGNPQHPASLGATSAMAQASVLTLYDPDRAQTVSESGRVRSWDEALGALRAALGARPPRRAPASASSPKRSRRRR